MIPLRFVLPEPPADQASVLDEGGVAVWREAVELPSYAPEEPTRFPMFLDRRVYQGSSGKVYPLPFIERIGRTREPRLWDAVHLENRWVRLMILPELGGRIHVGYDKVAGYDFFYRNNVIKPALVGLAGPWISGGVEFNWPQHHRPATFLPTETVVERRDDGAVVVWSSDHDPFARMRGTHGIVLRPDSSLIELSVRLHNRTPEPQTFLWWANVAANTSGDYQSFFPTDVRYVADHARRAVTSFPAADGCYYGVDYAKRADAAHPDAARLDFYRSIPVPTSYMVLETQDSFFGGYDHDAQAGFVHWAERAIAPGKKQWTWGNAPFGYAWDRLLTDGDGPYVELMAGVYTDNQPDFSYLAPGETRAFSQYWYPISRIGVVHQATRDAAVSVRRQGDALRVGVVATRRHDGGVLVVEHPGSGMRLERAVVLDPSAPVLEDFELAAEPAEVRVTVLAGERVLVAWEAHGEEGGRPAVATEPPAPAEVASADQLYLTAVHLRQYRHPTRSPEPYLAELLRRDPGDSRGNTMLSELLLARGEDEAAAEAARRALARLTERNSNPRDGEASYRLGLALAASDPAAAADAFAKAEWDLKWQHAAALERAFLAARSGDDATALSAVRRALERGADDARARALLVTVLRRLGATAEADAELAALRRDEPLDRWGRALAGIRLADAAVSLDIAVDAAAAGDLELALALLERAAEDRPDPAGNVAAVALYLAAALQDEAGRDEAAAASRARARAVDRRLAFPAGRAALGALRAAIAAEPADAAAHALLGTWLYGVGRRAEAREAWQRAVELDETDAVSLRNLAVAAVNVADDVAAARDAYDRAIALMPLESRLWMERDTLDEREGVGAAERLERLLRRPAEASPRDDLTVVTAELLSLTGRFAEAHALLSGQELQPWEGGEGRALAAWEHACLGLARQALERGDAEAARAWAQSALDSPESLGEARHLLAGIADILVVLGDALAALGEREAAEEQWRRALDDPSEPSTPAAHAKTFWVGVAAVRLGLTGRAEAVWSLLDTAAERLERDGGMPDYFATSLPSTLLFDSSPRVIAREAKALRELAAQGRRLSGAASDGGESGGSGSGASGPDGAASDGSAAHDELLPGDPATVGPREE